MRLNISEIYPKMMALQEAIELINDNKKHLRFLVLMYFSKK